MGYPDGPLQQEGVDELQTCKVERFEHQYQLEEFIYAGVIVFEWVHPRFQWISHYET